MLDLLIEIKNLFNHTLDRLISLGDFLLRILIFKVFFMSGLLKLQSWDSTLALFTNEYHVPLLSSNIAAIDFFQNPVFCVEFKANAF